MAIPKELLDELLKQVGNPEEIFGKDGLIKELTWQMAKRVIWEYDSIKEVIPPATAALASV